MPINLLPTMLQPFIEVCQQFDLEVPNWALALEGNLYARALCVPFCGQQVRRQLLLRFASRQTRRCPLGSSSLHQPV